MSPWTKIIAKTIVFSALMSCGATTPLNIDTFSPAGVLSGSVMTQERCNHEDTSVWVVVEGQGECVRYFHAGLKRRNPIVHVWFHGDHIRNKWSGNRPGSGIISSHLISYGYQSPEDLRKHAHRMYGQFGLPYIRFSRPGVYGSSGDHNQRRRPREALIVNAALDALKDKYDIQSFVLSGQSGGGHIVASLLTMRRDILCGVSTSGVVAVRQRSLVRGWGGLDVTGYSDFFDPIENVDRVPPDSARRIFIVGDPRDANVPFETQVDFVGKLKEKGHQVWLMTTRGSGPEHHDTSGTGFLVANLCAAGAPTDEILKVAREAR